MSVIEDLCVPGHGVQEWSNPPGFYGCDGDHPTFKQALLDIDHADHSHFSHTLYTLIQVSFMQFSEILKKEMSAFRIIPRGHFLKIPKYYFFILTFSDKLLSFSNYTHSNFYTISIFSQKIFILLFFFFLENEQLKKTKFRKKIHFYP